MEPAQPEARRSDSLLGSYFEQLVVDARGVRLGVSLFWIAWLHLLIFAVCEFLFWRGDRAATHFLPLWMLDAGGALLLVRQRLAALVALRSGLTTKLLLRVWLTFVILCLTSASLNSLTGFEIDWFKISWAMLGTFGFAVLAWIFHLAFLVPAVQMSITALLIAAHPDHAYAIFGVSWFLTLQGLTVLLENHRLPLRAFERSIGRDRVVIRHRSPEV